MKHLTSNLEKPSVALLGEDGNVFVILGKLRKAAFKAGWSKEMWEEFYCAATSNDYDHALATACTYFDVQ